jgi:putative transposase
VERLAVKNMVKNHHLAAAISDAGWGEFVRQLQYTCDWYGKNLIRIGTFLPSSRTCSGCGHVLEELDLSVREWTCPVCSLTHDRDINAAKNIR